MKKKNKIRLFGIILYLINLFIFKFAIAEVIVLKSGDNIEANIIEKTDKFITVDYKGISISYYIFEVKSINGEDVSAPLANTILSGQGKPGAEEVKPALKPADSEVVKMDIISPEMYLKRGMAYYSKGNFNQAISDFNKAIKVDPNYSIAYAKRGLAYFEKKDTAYAISDYTKAIAINPRYEEAYYIRGLAYASQEKFEQAISDYAKAIEINPDYVQAYINRGFINTNKGNLEQAISDFDKALKINPDIGAVYYLRGAAYANKGNLGQAILDYTKAIEKNPNDAQSYANRGLVCAYKIVSERSLKIDKNSPMAYINLSSIDINKEEFKAAISDCNKAIEINPNFPDAYINRLRVYIFMKEYDKAWNDLYKAEALGAMAALQILEDLKKASGREK
ncbi:MAG: tetratricopeptide repeat protein [Candidatus Omnitrophota bacterium]|nr:tetratricopeptide repeat protein [Candidatus Omnitrophota bacterium]